MPASSDNLGFKSHTKNHAQIPRSSELFLLYGRHQRGAGWERCRLAGSQLGQDARARVNSRPPLMRPTGATDSPPSSQLFPFFCVSFGCTSCHFVIFFSEGVHTSHINTLTHTKNSWSGCFIRRMFYASHWGTMKGLPPVPSSIIRDGKEKASAAKEILLLLSTHKNRRARETGKRSGRVASFSFRGWENTSGNIFSFSSVFNMVRERPPSGPSSGGWQREQRAQEGEEGREMGGVVV